MSKHKITGEPGHRLIPLVRWSDYHSAPSVYGMRWLHQNRERFRCAEMFERLGRRVLVNEAAFFSWLQQHGRDASMPATRQKRKPAGAPASPPAPLAAAGRASGG